MTDFLASLLAEIEAKDAGGARDTFAGIDLGTTNSSLTLLDGSDLLEGEVERALHTLHIKQTLVRDEERLTVSSHFLPSVVARAPDGEGWLVGHGARELRRRRGYLPGRNLFFSFKSEMGIGREPYYHHAVSPEVDTPCKVAVKVLEELRRAAGEEGVSTAAAVVTVPASYQSSQRKDTLRAADLAGFSLGENDLLDEPNAALLDYLLAPPHESPFVVREATMVLVFDFGGGTCDVSIVEAAPSPSGRGLTLRNLAISRYERIGGDDIDREIASRVLLPQLLRENGLDPLDLPFSFKEQAIVPRLAEVAEELKIGLCTRHVDGDLGKATSPPLKIEDSLPKPLHLSHPSLSMEELEKVLDPFLDTDLLYPRQTDFGTVTPVFAPVTDAMARARLSPSDIDAVLLVGGSSLIPQVRQKVRDTFPRAQLLGYPTATDAQIAVSRGAAWQAYFLATLGRPLLRPIAQQRIGLLTLDGRVFTILPAGTQLPCPAGGGFREIGGLVVGGDSRQSVDVVIVGETTDRVIHHGLLPLDMPRPADSEIKVAWRFDANKLLEMRLFLEEDPNVNVLIPLENPICPTSIPSENRRRIDELEAGIADAEREGIPPVEKKDDIRELGACYAREGLEERALEWYRKYISLKGGPDYWALVAMAEMYDRLGKPGRAERTYHEAMEIDHTNGAAAFNLSLLRWRRGRHEEALASIRQAMHCNPNVGPYHIIYGLQLRESGETEEGDGEVLRGTRILDQNRILDEWEQHWRMRAAKALGETDRLEALKKEAGRRMSRGAGPGARFENLPGVRRLP